MAWYNDPISHGYITSYQGAGTDTPHYAVDIAAPMHTPFSFPTSGTIVQADYAVWSGQPGGGEVFLKPDDGGEEQYVYHLDEVDVHSGQHVNAGQQVGLSGGQNSGGSHPVSPMWSSGPHIHYGFFQKYVNTPAGGRPFGSDPTAYVQNLSKNNGALISPIGTSLLPGAGGSGGSSGLASLIPMPTQDQLIRGALMLGGAILIIMGLHSLLQKSNVFQLPDTDAATQNYQQQVSNQRSALEASEKAEQQASKESTQRYLRGLGRRSAPPPPPGQGKLKEAAEIAEVA